MGNKIERAKNETRRKIREHVMSCTRIWGRVLLAPSDASARRRILAPNHVLLSKSESRANTTTTTATTTTTTKEAATPLRLRSDLHLHLQRGALCQALSHAPSKSRPLHQAPALFHTSHALESALRHQQLMTKRNDFCKKLLRFIIR